MTTVEGLLNQIEELRTALYARLREERAEALEARPVPGEWSVVENVRHLLFAEQLHLGRLLPERVQWSPVGLRTDGRKRPPEVGSEPTQDLEEVLTAWDAEHGSIREAASTADTAKQHLERNLKHLRAHIETIERLLSAERAQR